MLSWYGFQPNIDLSPSVSKLYFLSYLKKFNLYFFNPFPSHLSHRLIWLRHITTVHRVTVCIWFRWDFYSFPFTYRLLLTIEHCSPIPPWNRLHLSRASCLRSLLSFCICLRNCPRFNAIQSQASHRTLYKIFVVSSQLSE